MSTRGSIGFRIDGQDKLTYNHYDSYPSWLGVSVLHQVQELVADPDKLEELKEKARRIKLFRQDDRITPEILEITKPYHDLAVSKRSLGDPYCLFHGMQGDLKAMLDAGYILDASSFILDSLFCEWAYILNLDDEAFEVFVGFQKKPTPGNRYGTSPRGSFDGNYYPCKMIREYTFDELLELTDEDFVQELEELEGEAQPV